MSCVWVWLQNLVNMLAVPTFLLLIWQILRAEWLVQPPDLVISAERDATELEIDGAPYRSIRIDCSSPAGDSLFNARVIPLANTKMLHDFTALEALPVLDADERLTALFAAPVGSPVAVMFVATRQAKTRRRRVAIAARAFVGIGRTDEDGTRYGPVSLDVEQWRWYRTAWIRYRMNRLLARLSIRGRFHLGRFHTLTRRYWKSDVPQEDWMSQTKLPRRAHWV